MQAKFLAGAALAALAATPAFASSFTTVDISSYVNANVAINAYTFPTGTTSGNQYTGIPFAVATYGGVAGTWLAGAPGSSLTVNNVGASGQSSFYALLNNYYGTYGADEYDITITATNGDSVTYQSIGGVDTRDYNSNVFTNTIARTTRPWYDNGIGQRLDVRQFTLPDSFKSETVASFTITQEYAGNYGDNALFSGLTFSTASAAAVPEPASDALMLAGLGALGLMARRRARACPAA